MLKIRNKKYREKYKKKLSMYVYSTNYACKAGLGKNTASGSKPKKNSQRPGTRR
jgi:hypothetical protein